MMQWQKLGQIFKFSDSPFRARYTSHAQSPQALLLADRTRVYFSTRELDDSGKFLSHVQYVDYDSEFKNIIDYSEHEVIPLGKLGCFDEHGIFPLSPVRVGDKIYGYTNGISRRTSVDVESGIGFCVSTDDGRTYQKPHEGPLMSASLYEPFLVGDAFVRFFAGKYHMFYLYGKKWSDTTVEHASERVYKIGHAVSEDGLEWVRMGGIIADTVDENECQALPTVIELNGRYHMYFCYRHMAGFRTEKGKGYQIGYAYSDDLEKWTRADDQAGICLSETGWDSEMMCYPNIFESDNQVFLLYNGNTFGRDGFGLAKLMKD